MSSSHSLDLYKKYGYIKVNNGRKKLENKQPVIMLDLPNDNSTYLRPRGDNSYPQPQPVQRPRGCCGKGL